MDTAQPSLFSHSVEPVADTEAARVLAAAMMAPGLPREVGGFLASLAADRLVDALRLAGIDLVRAPGR